MDTPTTDATPIAFKIIKGTWGHKKIKLKNKFGHLNDEDLFFAEGKEAELLVRLAAKLNRSEAEVQKLVAML